MRTLLDKSPYPNIVSGDFNSVPGSFTYHRIKGDLQDTFLKKGAGLGNTYVGLSPTLRIDYILADKSFDVLQYKSPTLFLSDHFPVIADLKWK
jgi:endonuclease/exonuclease/phosphatase family metal-dependent hydrolase